MFQTKLAPVHLPSIQAIADLEREAVRRESAITDEMLAKLLVPEHYGKKLKELWDESVSMPRDVREVELFCHTSRHGDVLLVSYSDHGQTDIKLVVLPLCDDEDSPDSGDETGFFEIAASDAGKWTAEECDFLRGVWTAFTPTIPIKAKTTPGPNSPCPCGAMNSGGKPKKYKRCCGGF